MKIFIKIAITSLIFSIFIPNFFASTKLNAQSVISSNEIKIEIIAEELYKKINMFLIENKDIFPENFDNVCREWMEKDSYHIKLLSKKEFDNELQNSLILYRGMNEKRFTDNLKNGMVYFPSNLKNIRGIGVYTTTCLDCAKYYSDENNPDTVVKMLIPQTEIKILENEYLEKLKEIICNNHKEEFGEFTADKKSYHIFDSMSGYLKEQLSEVNKKSEKIEDINEQQKLIDKVFKKIEQDPIYQELKSSRKIFFKTNKAALFYNSGLLTKLLGYDALHTIDYLRDFVDFKEEEYLIVNPQILSVLKD